MQLPLAAETVKEQVVDHVPQRIKELQFGILSEQDIVNQSVLELVDNRLYELEARNQQRDPIKYGPLDRRMGCAPKQGECPTCNRRADTCNGHFGHFRLALPAFHVGYFKMTITILQEICKDCSHILLSEKDRRSFLAKVRKPDIDNLARTRLCKKILEQCKKTSQCFRCGATNGIVKKSGSHPLKIIHDKYRKFNVSHALSKKPPRSKVLFDESFHFIRREFAEVDKHQKKALDDMNPLRVLNLFRRISPLDCELLGMDPEEGRPEMFIWQYIPAPPLSIRPSVAQDLASTEDDLTAKLCEIILSCKLIKESLREGKPTSDVMEKWDMMQLQLAIYINSDVPGLQQSGKSIRGFCQRLKGKQGRFRGNLSGKRVDFSGRTVISPDPNLAINEVAVPERVAMTLTYPEKVTAQNIEKLKQRVRNGPFKYPGAVQIINTWGQKLQWKQANIDQNVRNLRIGYTVERHLEDGDIVLFNRQPSLHKLSILCHFVKVRPYRTFRLNECVCNPYNADFDGDEMNLHVPQTEEARTEAMELMGVKHNLATPKNGEPIISAIQDFITASYLLSSKDVFYDRKSFTNICMYMVDGNLQIDLPPPAILKPQMLWTGKQVFNVMMRPNKSTVVFVNLEAQCREFKAVKGQPRDLDQNDGYLVIRNSEIMCGVMDKSTIGSGKKDSVFYVILRDFGPDAAIHAMSRLAKLSARWLTNQGFSIGIGDVHPGGQLTRLKTELVEKAYAECDELIVRFKEGKLAKAAGCDEETTLENEISGLLSNVRGKAGEHCISELSKHNAPLIMASSGSKGSYLNVSQMVATVGQQIIGGKRVEEGFQDRTLPHFPKQARSPPSKGFVRNSFFSGLSPSEFLFHAMSGREGLVDTAVKTAETGYMSRRLVKSLEDLSSQYDTTVRNSIESIVQFRYGDDLLDPVNMEGKAKPVHFERTFMHCEAVTWNNDDAGLLPWEIMDICQALLAPEEAKHPRYNLNGQRLDYHDTSEVNTDQFESVRSFLTSVRHFIQVKVEAQIEARKRLKLPLGDKKEAAATSRRDRPPTKGKFTRLESVLHQVHKLSKKTLETFIKTCLAKYHRAQVEPGHAVGVISAQSIGEPGTQMTLKTFHFAGVAGMSITEGVPRIKEIINASEKISTPIITCELETQGVIGARAVKGRIEKTHIGDVIHALTRHARSSELTLKLSIDLGTISNLQLDIGIPDVIAAIRKAKKLKIDSSQICFNALKPNEIIVALRPEHEDLKKAKRSIRTDLIAARPKSKEAPDPHHKMDLLQRLLPQIVVSGHPDAQRAVIAVDERDERRHRILVEGYGLRECMGTRGVDFRRTRTNSVVETLKVLGIEAARRTIIDEISMVMRTMDIDPRHMQLLADVMTYKGEVLGITRFGLAKMRDSILQLASFEKTPDHLFEAAWHMKSDDIRGVSECIIMGQEMGLGTGACRVVRDLGFRAGEVGRKGCVFEDAWRELRGGGGGRR